MRLGLVLSRSGIMYFSIQKRDQMTAKRALSEISCEGIRVKAEYDLKKKESACKMGFR